MAIVDLRLEKNNRDNKSKIGGKWDPRTSFPFSTAMDLSSSHVDSYVVTIV